MHNTPSDINTEVGSMSTNEQNGILQIDLSALQKNYKQLDHISGQAECAAVVKADAYGLGLEHVVPALIDKKCKTFFVANLSEAIRLRCINSNVDIFVLNGFTPNFFQHYHKHKLTPVLNSHIEVSEWLSCSENLEADSLPVALQVNTGMNRLGLAYEDLTDDNAKQITDKLRIKLLMSHLACADDPSHSANQKQLDMFLKFRELFPSVKASLCNSAGIFLGKDYHFDLVRPGIALYGGKAQSVGKNPMASVVQLKARILQILEVRKGDFVGYGAQQHMKRDSRLATLSLGYADGYLRALSSSDQSQSACVYINGIAAPIVGRVSMDLVSVDITDIPEGHVKRGDLAEIFGTVNSIDDVAQHAGTIDYELLTSLGHRYHRCYI